MPNTAHNILEFQNVTKNYHTAAGRVPVLKGVDIVFRKGESVALLGQSGSGKSTFLHMAGLLDKPSTGKILVNGAHVAKMKDKTLSQLRNQTFGFVYQQHHLLKEFTVLENVLLPAQFSKKFGQKQQDRALDLIEKVGLSKRLNHLPSQLSGGEQQRVALARALINKPVLLLADEPTGNLDAETAEKVTNLMFSLVKEEGLSLLLVTHSQKLAEKCNRVMTLKNGVFSG